jgi:hypothetical protein
MMRTAYLKGAHRTSKYEGSDNSPGDTLPRGGGLYPGRPRPVPGSRGHAPANLREALVAPLERLQVRGVVQVERRVRERHHPPSRRHSSRP